MPAQSEIFPMFVRAEYQQGDAFARFQSEAQRAANRTKQEFQAVGQVIDQALSVERNAAGSLNLGVDELRQAAAAQQQRAVAAREVADAALRAARSDGAFNAEMREGVQAARQYATEQEKVARSLQSQVTVQDAVQRELNQTASATQEVINAQRRGTDARGSVINSTRAERTAFIQLGQQLQDVTIQTQLGTAASQIFAQQVPQAAFALTGLSNSANKAKRAVGSFATFLSGPFGAAIFAGIAILGPYVAKLFEASDAADEARFSSDALSEAQSILGTSIEIVTGKINVQSEALRNLAQAQILAGQVESARRQAELRTELGEAAREKGDLISGPLGVPIPVVTGGRRFEGFLRRDSDAADVVQSFLEGDRNARQAINRLKELEEAGRVTEDQLVSLSSTIANLGVEERNSEIFEAADRLLNGEATDEDRGLLLKPGKTGKKGGGSRKSAQDRERELDRLREFAAEAAREIDNIGRGFDRVPPGVERVNRSVQQLDDLIAELQDRQPPNFEGLVDQAEAVRDALADGGVQRLLEQDLFAIAEAQAEQFEIQKLILLGREEEADVLRIMSRLQSQYGEEADQYLDIVEQIVDARAREELQLAAIGEQLEAYRSATQGIRGELESLFSGEGFDPQRVFNRLRSQLQVEALFGDALRQIDAAVDDSFEQAVDDIVHESERLEETLERLVKSTEEAAARLDSVRPAGSIDSAGYRQAFDANFGATSGVIPSGGVLGASNDNEIIVAAAKAQRDGLGGMRVDEYATLLGRTFTDPILQFLPESIATSLSPVLSQAIGGYFLAGPTGGILGGLNSIFGARTKLGGEFGVSAFGVDDIFGTLFEGAGNGATVDLLFDALGIKSSGTGAAIGGAVGSVLGPIGSLVGSIAGSLLGGLFGGTARGSAIIGSSGGALGVTGFYGGNDEREAAANNLARTAIETVERLAAELGATVNASAGRVSIGIREDSINVDPQGRGFTKTSKFPDIRAFGEDAEAAILFAVQDLIEDGVIGGLSAAEQRLIRAGNDIEQAITDVLTFRNVFDRLEGIENPLRAEIRALNTEFEDLIDLFERAGASAEQFADLERLYDLERAKLIEDATDRVAGSLKSLIEDLTTGDAGFSLRDRRAAALDSFNGLAARVEAGDTSAFDDFEQAARTLIEIERQIFGSQEDYFARLDEILAISRGAVAEQEALISSGSDFGSPFGNGNSGGINPIGVPIAEQTAELGARLDAVIANIGTTNQILRSLAGPRATRAVPALDVAVAF